MADQTTPAAPDADEGLVQHIVHAVEDALHSDPALAPHDAPAVEVPVEHVDTPPVEIPVAVVEPPAPVEIPVEHDERPAAEVFIDYREPENVLRRENIVSDGPGTVGHF